MITLRYRTLVAFLAGVTLTIVAGFTFQTWRADAWPGDFDTTFVPITPCRLLDTRPGDDQVGPRDTPIGEDSPVPFTAWDSGDDDSTCEIPDSATAISTNTTIVNPTKDSFLTLYPADEAWPGTANLNYVAGQAPTPNAVTIPLSPTGKFNIYNRFGTVDVVVDVNGFHTKTSLKDIDFWLDDLYGLQPFAKTAYLAHSGTLLSDTPTAVVTVVVTAPHDGQVTVNSTAVFQDGATSRVACIIAKATDIPSSLGTTGESAQILWATNTGGSLSGTRTFDITPADLNVQYVLACQGSPAGAQVVSGNLTAIFTPTF